MYVHNEIVEAPFMLLLSFADGNIKNNASGGVSQEANKHRAKTMQARKETKQKKKVKTG